MALTPTARYATSSEFCALLTAFSRAPGEESLIIAHRLSLPWWRSASLRRAARRVCCLAHRGQLLSARGPSRGTGSPSPRHRRPTPSEVVVPCRRTAPAGATRPVAVQAPASSQPGQVRLGGRMGGRAMSSAGDAAMTPSAQTGLSYTSGPGRWVLLVTVLGVRGGLDVLAARQFCAARDDCEYLTADRAAAWTDEEPVGGEGSSGPRVRRQDAGLGAQQRACWDGFEAELHGDLDPAGLRPRTQGRSVQTRWRLPAQQTPGLAEPCRDHDLGPLGEQHRNRRDVKKGAPGQ